MQPNSYINPYRLFTGAFLPNWLLVRTEIGATAKLVYARLCQFADKQTGEAWPCFDTIASETGLGRATVARAVKDLVENKLISTDRASRTDSLLYRFLAHEWMGLTKAEIANAAPSSGSQDAKSQNDNSPSYQNDNTRVIKMRPNKNHIKESLSDSPHSSENLRGDAAQILKSRRGSGIPSSPEECVEYAKEIRLPSTEARAFFDYHEARGWKFSGSKLPVKNWQACLRTWKERYIERGGMLIPDPNLKTVSTLELIEAGEKITGKYKPNPIDPACFEGLLKYGTVHIG